VDKQTQFCLSQRGSLDKKLIEFLNLQKVRKQKVAHTPYEEMNTIDILVPPKSKQTPSVLEPKCQQTKLKSSCSQQAILVKP
jgi:hypothetical protein